MREAKPTTIKQMLIFILENLDRVYPVPLQARSLYRVMISLYNNYTESLMNKDITYLKQKGYIEYINENIGVDPEFMDKCIGLTAKGKEIAMRTQTDPALEI